MRIHLILFLASLIGFSVGYFVLKSRVSSEDHFLQLQLLLSRGMIGVIFLQIGWVVLGKWYLFRQVMAAFFYRPTAPQNLALMRIVLMTLLAGHLAFQVLSHLGQVAALPHSARQGLPLVGWVIDIIPISPGIYSVMTILGIVFCVLAAMGLFTRASLIFSALILLYVLGVPNFFGKVNHTHFMVWIPAFLAFAPAGEVWSLDSVFRRRRGVSPHTDPHFRYGIPMRLIFLQLGMIYFFSAIGKLWFSGLDWALSDNLVYLMRLEWLENFSAVPTLRLDLYPWLCRFLALGVIAFELGYVFLIITPKTRVPAALSAIAFHNITNYFLLIDFKFLQMLNAFHLDWFAFFRKVKALMPAILGGVLCIGLGVGLLLLNHPLGMLFLAAAVVVVFFKKPAQPSDLSGVNLPVSKWVWRIGLGILLINAGFGITQTTSWPFTAYPSYSFVRKGTVEYIWFKPVDPNGKVLDLDSLSQVVGFKKENILGMAEDVKHSWKSGDRDAFETSVNNYWLRFREKLPPLKVCNSAPVFLQELSTDPDIGNPVVKEERIGVMVLEGGKWGINY